MGNEILVLFARFGVYGILNSAKVAPILVEDVVLGSSHDRVYPSEQDQGGSHHVDILGLRSKVTQTIYHSGAQLGLHEERELVVILFEDSTNVHGTSHILNM
jgi:hypothetical protein